METAKVLNEIARIEAHIELATRSVAVLKRELGSGGAPTGSPRKGNLSEKEKAKILGKRQKNRLRKINY